MIKINLGSGRQIVHGYLNVDYVQITGSNGRKLVDYVVDIEKEKLPFKDNSVDTIRADNVFEHLGDGFIFALNECHRVLKKKEILYGVVPLAGSDKDFADITHKRHFNMNSFSYITGVSLAFPNRPSRPRYTDYGVLPWIKKDIIVKNDLIYFNLTPNK